MADNKKWELEDEQLDAVTGGVGGGIQVGSNNTFMNAGKIASGAQSSAVGGGIQISGNGGSVIIESMGIGGQLSDSEVESRLSAGGGAICAGN